MQRNAGNFNCNKCPRNHYCDESGEWPGSRGPAGFVVCEIPGVIASHTCLLPLITPTSRALLSLHVHYKNRLLPFNGGLLDQPQYFIAAMELLENA